jgi:Ca2+-binding EF-hand superfamily protein
MDPSEDDYKRIFSICDTDGDGFLTKDELENILKDIGVEQGNINDFMWGLQAEEFITFPQFVDAIEKFQSHGTGSYSLIQSLSHSTINHNSPRSLSSSAIGVCCLCMIFY